MSEQSKSNEPPAQDYWPSLETHLKTDFEIRLGAIVATTPECVKVVAKDGSLLHMNEAG